LQKAQIAVLVSCQHHLYTADLHQMVLHRPVECTAFIGTLPRLHALGILD
jgi:hypothetical protein